MAGPMTTEIVMNYVGKRKGYVKKDGEIHRYNKESGDFTKVHASLLEGGKPRKLPYMDTYFDKKGEYKYLDFLADDEDEN